MFKLELNFEENLFCQKCSLSLLYSFSCTKFKNCILKQKKYDYQHDSNYCIVCIIKKNSSLRAKTLSWFPWLRFWWVHHSNYQYCHLTSNTYNHKKLKDFFAKLLPTILLYCRDIDTLLMSGFWYLLSFPKKSTSEMSGFWYFCRDFDTSPLYGKPRGARWTMESSARRSYRIHRIPYNGWDT